MTKTRHRSEWLVAAVVLLIGMSVGSLLFMVQRIDVFSSSFRANYWVTAQTESDFLRLEQALKLYISGSPFTDYKDLRLRLDLFYSRLSVFLSEDSRELVELPGVEAYVQDLVSMADALDRITADPGFRNGPEAEIAVALLEEQWLPLHLWTRKIIHGELWMDERVSLLSDLHRLLWVNALFLIVSIVVIVGILIQLRRHRRLVDMERNARHDAEMAMKSRDRFLASMSHDLRTPLNAVVGFSDLLISEIRGPLPPAQADYIRDIQASGNHLLAMINDILDFSKLDARMRMPVWERCDLCDIVDRAVKFEEPGFIANGGRIRTRCDKRAFYVRTDGRLALQCLTNLISNAAKFSPADGTIDVTLDDIGRTIVVRITDEGPGLSLKEIEQAFEPFQQIGDPYKTKAGGTGLGLSICKTISNILDLRLELAPRADRTGLQVTLEFTKWTDDDRPSADMQGDKVEASLAS
ncbi:sensor histidine kinase [Pacificispira spongiicola]|nr:HAMP domain-containing sensor histidine kinase [Pacificispira spongiicola]